MENIQIHFDNLGGLKPASNATVSSDEFQKNIDDINGLQNAQIDNVLVTIWKTNNGCIFKKGVGIKVDQKIPLLMEDQLITFSRFFAISEKGDFVYQMIKSNKDIFKNTFVPFAEALEGDFFAWNKNDNGIYFIMHDFSVDEKNTYKVARDARVFFTNIQAESESRPEIEPEIVKSNLSKGLLGKLKDFKKENP